MSTTMTETTQVRLPTPTAKAPVPQLPSHNVSKQGTDGRSKTMNKLFNQLHRSVAPLRDPELILHSHMPHILGSAYYLGAPTKQLDDTYDRVIDTLKDINSQGLVRGEDAIPADQVKEYMFKKEYTVAWTEFFDKKFREADGDWKKVIEFYLFNPEYSLMNGLIGGLGHPIIHLHYAYEYGSAHTASEGMSLLCTDYFAWHDLLDKPPPDISTYKTQSLADIVERVRQDTRFDNLCQHRGIANLETVMSQARDAVLEHWQAWDIVDPVQALEHICDVSTLLAISTGDADKSFDFFLIHLMTTAHAIRYLWHIFPEDRKEDMLREYALMVVSTYVCQLRPAIDMGQIEKMDTKGRDWEWVRSTAIEHPAKFDVHFFKVVRGPKVFAEAYGEKDDFYLKASLKFLDEFTGFEGFPPAGPGQFDPRFEGWQKPGKFD